jgi:hypothetical protein
VLLAYRAFKSTAISDLRGPEGGQRALLGQQQWSDPVRGFFLTIVFVVLSVVFAIGFIILYAISHTDAEAGQLSVIAVVSGSFAAAALAVFGPEVMRAIGGRKQAAEKLDKLTTDTRNFIEHLEQCREFSDVKVSGLHLRDGEFVVRCERATLAKFSQARVGGGLGTRVRVAGFPIYVGGWKSIPQEELREAGIGDLVLTNCRLLFIGAQTLTIPFDKLLKCEQVDAGLVVSVNSRGRPHVLILEHAGLWCFLVNWVSDNRFENRRLPDDIHLAVIGGPPNLEIHVSRAASPPPLEPS